VHAKSHKEAITLTPITNHVLKSEVAITLHLWQCSAGYTALQMNDSVKKLLCNESMSHLKKANESPFKNLHLALSAKKLEQRRTMLAP